ncbi:MAG: N-acetylmuramoyl-L-alanine amidase [Odoribacteraceae bacterium]|jgi:N-acetylmuramoyl-L-alanine amidase|nr:N-acetylmuramoyl-L-alanine amidase [Odoribacteraceae bacterium]
MINRGKVPGLIAILVFFCFPGSLRGQAVVEKLSCICIDPGHGGVPGAVNGKVMEKDVVLDISLKLGAMIQRAYPNMKIVYTRTKDAPVDLKERGAIANRAKAQLFISIHANSHETAPPQGTEVFVLGLDWTEASLEVAMRENSAIYYEADYSVKYSGFTPDDMESYILYNHLQNTFLSNSTEFAGHVHDEIVKALGTTARGIKQGLLIVLKEAAMPAVLIETAFISNVNDLKKLASPAGRDKFARAIFRAFVTYKEEWERNSVLIQNAPEEEEQGKSLVYAIQVVSAKGRITNFKRFNLQDKVEELRLEDRYCYYVRACSSYNEAVRNQQDVRKKVKDCFVIALLDGKPIPVSKARQIENEQKK